MENKRILIPAACLLLASVTLMSWILIQPPEVPAYKPATEKPVAAASTSSGPSTRNASASSDSTSNKVASVSAPQVASSSPTVASVPSAKFLPTSPVKSSDAVQRSASIAASGDVNGLVANAQVAVGGQKYSFEPNALGLFPMVTMEHGKTANFTVAYPGGVPGDLVTIQSEDGGVIADGKPVIQAHLDDNRQIAFPFNSTQEGGLYRVTLRNGFDQKRLEFWATPAAGVQNAAN